MKTGADWDARYREPEYVFGTAANDFLVDVAREIPRGPVLSLAAGEGRNEVYLAELGYDVTAVDFSAVGLAKARDLAARRGVALRTVHADLSTYRIKPGVWNGIVAIFGHFPPEIRRPLYREVAGGLKPGGLFILEAYAPAQLERADGGGPRDPDLLIGAAALQRELPGLEWLLARELDREVNEGTRHRGLASVVQLLGRRAGDRDERRAASA